MLWLCCWGCAFYVWMHLMFNVCVCLCRCFFAHLLFPLLCGCFSTSSICFVEEIVSLRISWFIYRFIHWCCSRLFPALFACLLFIVCFCYDGLVYVIFTGWLSCRCFFVCFSMFVRSVVCVFLLCSYSRFSFCSLLYRLDLSLICFGLFTVCSSFVSLLSMSLCVASFISLCVCFICVVSIMMPVVT